MNKSANRIECIEPPGQRIGSWKPLLVLASPLASVAGAEWAHTAQTATEGMALLRQYRHTLVFVDFERLACGTTGTQLARRVRAEDPGVSLFLLARNVHPTMAMWGRSCGAFAVLPRSCESIASCLSGWIRQACRPDDSGKLPLTPTLQAARRIVISSLLSLGRMNSDALLALDEAVAELHAAQRWGGAEARATDTAHAIAERLGPVDHRVALLDWLAQVAPAGER